MLRQCIGRTALRSRFIMTLSLALFVTADAAVGHLQVNDLSRFTEFMAVQFDIIQIRSG
jgi:hypothetical protein